MTDPVPCPDCGAPILWLTTAKGARMPVDAEPNPIHGNITSIGGHAAVLNPAQARGARATGAHLHVHHKLTCPYADRWSNRR